MNILFSVVADGGYFGKNILSIRAANRLICSIVGIVDTWPDQNISALRLFLPQTKVKRESPKIEPAQSSTHVIESHHQAWRVDISIESQKRRVSRRPSLASIPHPSLTPTFFNGTRWSTTVLWLCSFLPLNIAL
jgi:hypothetical protein